MAKKKSKSIQESMNEKEVIATTKERQELRDAEWEAKKGASEKAPPRNKKALAIKIAFAAIVLSLIGTGGFFGYKYYTDEARYKGQKLEKVSLDQEVLKYAFSRERDIYRGISSINNELLLIENEITRLESIQKRYPKQKKITESEKKFWNKTKKDLNKILSGLEAKIEQLYVLHLANPEKGEEAMENEAKALIQTIEKALETSGKATERLKGVSVNGGVLGKIKQLKEKIF